MKDQIISSNIVALQPPYKIIKYGQKIGVQTGTQLITIAGGEPFRVETHEYPVVAAEDRITALEDKKCSIDASSDFEVWNNVETKDLSVLCEYGVPLTWQDYIRILWHDHARYEDRRNKIQKYYIFKKIIKYIGSISLPEVGLHTIHLLTEKSSEGKPEIVRSMDNDVFALNVVWTDQVEKLERRVVEDVMEYLLVISPNRIAKHWNILYVTNEDSLRPLVSRLNSNIGATRFGNRLMGIFTIKYIPSYKEGTAHSDFHRLSDEKHVKKDANNNNLSFNIFHDNLNEESIINELRTIDRCGCGEKQFVLAVKELMFSLGWLVNKKDTDFVFWMKDNQIVSFKDTGLTHVNHSHNMDNLKTSLKTVFQFKNSLGKWEDNATFYKKDRLKINNGK